MLILENEQEKQNDNKKEQQFENVSKSIQLPACANDIDIIGCTKRDVTAAFSSIEREYTKMGLAVNKDKTKYMLSTSRDV